MGAHSKSRHHNLDLKVNFRVLEKSARRLSLKLWPAAIVGFLAKLILEVVSAKAFGGFWAVTSALWIALVIMLLGYGLTFLVLFVGTKSKMRQARNNPGPGKPPREARG